VAVVAAGSKAVVGSKEGEEEEEACLACVNDH